MRAIDRLTAANNIVNTLMSLNDESEYAWLNEIATSRGVAIVVEYEGMGVYPNVVYEAPTYEDLHPIWDTIYILQKIRKEKYL